MKPKKRKMDSLLNRWIVNKIDRQLIKQIDVIKKDSYSQIDCQVQQNRQKSRPILRTTSQVSIVKRKTTCPLNS